VGDIKGSIEGAVAHLTEHLDEAGYTDSLATATLRDDLRAEVRGPNGESTVTDMASAVGGLGELPSPGWLLRAAVASCVATVIGMEAARDGVSLGRVEVEVDSESDDRGILGMDPGVPAGPASMSVRVRIEGDADDAKLRAIAKRGAARCPVCDAVKRAVPVSVEVSAG